MREALNTISLNIYRTMCESGHLYAHVISNVLSCCKPPTTYWFLNLGIEINVIGFSKAVFTPSHDKTSPISESIRSQCVVRSRGLRRSTVSKSKYLYGRWVELQEVYPN
ncbi:hypothetical protein TNCV_3716391 [Trichonephila clavipes]|nr:hypothetical protein TNCV_3716391 [Trichonephila clavipes]